MIGTAAAKVFFKCIQNYVMLLFHSEYFGRGEKSKVILSNEWNEKCVMKLWNESVISWYMFSLLSLSWVVHVKDKILDNLRTFDAAK